jgi:hypothetical protein
VAIRHGVVVQPGIMTATSSLTSAVSEPQGAGALFWRYFHGALGTPLAGSGVDSDPCGEGTSRRRL